MANTIEQLYHEVNSSIMQLASVMNNLHGKERFAPIQKQAAIDSCNEVLERTSKLKNEFARRKDKKPKTEPAPVVNGRQIVDVGRSFKGDALETVVVPVTSRPVLYKSKGGKYSWRTTVSGHNDARYINVGNFHSSYVENGNWFVVVDSRWVTNQPVFKDYCNK